MNGRKWTADRSSQTKQEEALDLLQALKDMQLIDGNRIGTRVAPNLYPVTSLALRIFYQALDELEKGRISSVAPEVINAMLQAVGEISGRVNTYATRYEEQEARFKELTGAALEGGVADLRAMAASKANSTPGLVATDPGYPARRSTSFRSNQVT